MIFDKVLTGSQSKAADSYAINILGIPSLELMANASKGVADEVEDLLPGDGKVAIFSGVGNNGADGINIARILIDKGYEIKVFICGKPEKASWEFNCQLEMLKEQLSENGLSWYDEECRNTIKESLRSFKPQILVDAIFGIGLHRNISGTYACFIDEINDFLSFTETEPAKAAVIAVDIPSGVNADTGQLMGRGIASDVTVTFGCNKTGLLTGAGPEHAGQIIIKDIGIPKEAYKSCKSV